MQYFLAVAPLMAAVYAQAPAVTSSSSSISIPPYSNPNTQYLTQTNSNGVITGMPSAAVAVTSQPILATIPAGLPQGVTTYPLVVGNNSVTYFTISVGSSTTVVLGGLPSGVTSVAGAGSTGSSGSGSGSGSGSSGGRSSSSSRPSGSSGNEASNTSSGSGSSASSEGAASSNMVIASGAVMGLGAFIAALL
ncbi:hypothetical protein TI39_contig265g00022 [Zymoseptoria brevis]|uniref:Period circadian protein n=1 Tax=Zymoseptoria brevis TaxID=1047168 RepID=A0A0F4GYA8_9PEZI|nr:hypothetical protein TI39_contig265g00022 [Zymoseptoria brevis]